MRPISTSHISINTFSVLLKGRVDHLLRPTSTSFIVTPTITFFIFMNTIIKMARRNRYKQQYTIVTWVMGVIVAGLETISTSPVITNSLSNTARVKMAGIFRTRYTSAIINYYIIPQITIIDTSILAPITTITTDTTILISKTTESTSLLIMNIFIYRTIKN